MMGVRLCAYRLEEHLHRGDRGCRTARRKGKPERQVKFRTREGTFLTMCLKFIFSLCLFQL